jgi:hypothetical protein
MVPVQTLHLAGVFTVHCYGPDGRLKWRDRAANLIVNAGLDYTLQTTLRQQTQVSAWYMGLVDNAGFTAFNGGDVMTGHGGWSENTQYSAGTRNTWTPGAPSSQTVVNATTCDFVMSAAATIKGMFITSDNTKGGTTGTLFSEAAFSAGNQACGIGDTLKSTYQVSASSP